MGATKKYFYSPDHLKLADLYKELGHPARVSLVQQMLKQPYSNCKDLQSAVQLSSSSVTQHLRVLHESGITGYEVIHNNCIYSVNPHAIDLLADNLLDFSTQVRDFSERVYCKDL